MCDTGNCLGPSGGGSAHTPANLKPSYRIAVIGDSNVGKTTLVMRYRDNKFCFKANTVGTDYVKIERSNSEIGDYSVMFVDTAGSEKFRAYTASGLHTCDCAFLVWSVDDEISLDNAGTWLNMVSQHAPADFPVFVLGSKCDMQDGIHITQKVDVEQRLRALKEEWQNVQSTHFVSAKEPKCGDDLETLMSEVVSSQAVVDAMRDRVARAGVQP